MKIYGEVQVIGYAVVVNVCWEVNNGGTFIDEERIISFCLDRDFAIKEYDKLTIDDFLNEEEQHTAVEVSAYLEEWTMTDSPNNFNREEELCKYLN